MTLDPLLSGLVELAARREGRSASEMDGLGTIVSILARHAQGDSRFQADPCLADPDQLGEAARLCNVGNVAVPPAIFRKSGRLTQGEWTRIRLHPEMGHALLLDVAETFGQTSLLELGMKIALHHHERWDGTGYPSGLAGTEIPLEARMVALADTYDALTRTRLFQSAQNHAEAMRVIAAERGRQFDPDLVDVLQPCADELSARLNRDVSEEKG